MKSRFSKGGVNFLEISWRATSGFAPIDEIQQFIINVAIHWRRGIFGQNLFKKGVGVLMLACRTQNMPQNANSPAISNHLTTYRIWPKPAGGQQRPFSPLFGSVVWICQMP
jgi:hypothetical protein